MAAHPSHSREPVDLMANLEASLAHIRLRSGVLPGHEIEWRYLNDAEFHMRVELAVQALERDSGVRLTPEDRSLASLAAAYALSGEESS